MHVQTIVYTAQMEQAVRWYRAFLGREPDHASDMWTVFSIGDARVALHHSDEPPAESRIALSIVSDLPLETVIQRLAEHGIEPSETIRSQPFGRSVVFRDPGGLSIQVNQYA